MADFNKVLEPGDYQNGIVNTVVEIPKGSTNKIEWDRGRAAFTLDRVEPKIFAKPVNYGFIPGTLDEDGDELDSLIVTDEPLSTGVWLEAKIIGILNFEDDGEADHKVVVVPADDRHTGGSITSLDDLGKRWQEQIEHHFSHYKDLYKPGSTKVLGWGNVEEAKKIIEQSIARANSSK
jgi:inorganic pyrophosphatase